MMTCPLPGEERVISIESLVRHFSVVADPRCQGKIEHRLIDSLVIAVCAVIACAESWDDIALYGRSKLAWLRTFLDLPNGIPSHDTFRRVFMLIDPDAFERGFAAWVGSLVDGFKREVIAINGKTLRRLFDRRRERSPLHLVSAWASEQGLVLGPSLFGEAAVSSRTTSRSGSRSSWPSNHASRAAFTSGRSCSATWALLFSRDAVALEEARQAALGQMDAPFGQRRA